MSASSATSVLAKQSGDVLRLDYVDGLRALAALWVVLHHVVETSEPTGIMGLPWLGPVVRSLFFGQFAVMVFLMLSGFCLYFPCVRSQPEAPRLTTSFGTYLLRRYVRITPPYLWAGAFCIALSQVPALQTGRWLSATPIDAKVVLSHLLLVHNLIPDHATKIDYPMWSVGLEFQLYLVFPALVWGFRHYGAAQVVALTLLVTAVIRATYRQTSDAVGAILHDGPFSYFEIFALGMLAARLTVRRASFAPPWLLGCVVGAGFGAVRFGSGNGLVHDLGTAAATFALLLLAADPGSRAARALSAPGLVRLGVFSYSIYLVHAPALHLLWMAQRSLELSPDATFALLALGGVPVIVALSYVFHRVFERPFMRIPTPEPAATSAAHAHH